MSYLNELSIDNEFWIGSYYFTGIHQDYVSVFIKIVIVVKI
jgi:hypothetical protein